MCIRDRSRGGGVGGVPALPEQAGHPVQQFVQVALDGQVPGDPGAGQAQLARPPQHAAQGAAVGQHQHGAGGRPGLAAVPGPDPDGQRGAQQGLGHSGQPRRGVGHLGTS